MNTKQLTVLSFSLTMASVQLVAPAVAKGTDSHGHAAHILSGDESDIHSLRHVHTGANGSCTRIFFLHIPKTGGTSVVSWLERELPSCIHTFNVKRAGWETVLQEDSKATIMPCRTISFHGNSPSLVDEHMEVQKWKLDLLKKGCDVLAFTVLREPNDHIRSAFEFWGHNRVRFSFKASVPSMMDNLQNQFIVTGFRGPKRTKNVLLEKVSEREMHLAMEALSSTMDLFCDTKFLDSCFRKILLKLRLPARPRQSSAPTLNKNPKKTKSEYPTSTHESIALDVALYTWAHRLEDQTHKTRK